LEAFALAVDEGSIAAAAARLRITGPAAAKRIRQLEELAGTPLLIRGRRGVTATEMGGRLYPLAREALAARVRVIGALKGAATDDPLRTALVTMREVAPATGARALNGAAHSAGQVDRQSAARFLGALRGGRYEAAASVVDKLLDRGLHTPAIYAELIEPAMRSIGELWETRAISPADEHLATTICAKVAARGLRRAHHAPPRSRERVMLAAAQGEQHVLGLQLAGGVLEIAGYDVVYLGADVPHESLINACRVHRPDVLGLTVTMALNVPATVAAITALGQLQRPPQMMIGGRSGAHAQTCSLGVAVVERCDRVLGVVEQLLAGAASAPAEA